MDEKPGHPQMILKHTVFCMYKNSGHRRVFAISYVCKANIGPDIPERRTDINGQVRMSLFLDIVFSLMMSLQQLWVAMSSLASTSTNHFSAVAGVLR